VQTFRTGIRRPVFAFQQSAFLSLYSGLRAADFSRSNLGLPSYAAHSPAVTVVRAGRLLATPFIISNMPY